LWTRIKINSLIIMGGGNTLVCVTLLLHWQNLPKKDNNLWIQSCRQRAREPVN
jgi:hypothetical protein